MFSNLKLATINWILAFFTLLITTIIIISAYFVEKNITVIANTWQVYQTDLSEKSRVESALRASIGYGGMVHNFKNYVLRHNDEYKYQAESNIGAAKAFLKHYATLDVSESESIAIEEILKVVTNYQKALVVIESMISKGNAIADIDKAIRIDDSPAEKGLTILRYAVASKQKNIRQLSKSRLIADLRAAIGYNGMIHKFKNYVLYSESNHEDELQSHLLIDEINDKLQQADKAIHHYRQLTLTDAETFALDEIESMLRHYSTNLKKIPGLIASHSSIHKVDKAVKVDDEPALRSFQILEHEANHQIANHSINVNHALIAVNESMQLGKWISVLSIILLLTLVIFLIRFYVIQPIRKLTDNMVRLADNQLDIRIIDNSPNQEIGLMAETVKVFKANLIKRFESEAEAEKANKALLVQLQENKSLYERSEKQANKALLMAERVTEAHKATEKAMITAKKGELLVSSILNTVRDGIITINSKGVIESFNPGAERMFGYQSHEVIGKNISLLMPEPDRSRHDDYIKTYEKGQSNRDQSVPLDQNAVRKNGEIFPVEVSINTITLDGEFKFTGLIRDITERKQKEAEIEKLAMTDSLTGLANRHQFNLRLHEMQQQADNQQSQFCLMTIDLDKFKPVNDRYGHHIGDVLLQRVADALVACCREIDTVVRLGGDEFAILLNNYDDLKEIDILANRIIEKLKIQFLIENHHVQIGASIGISCYPNDTKDIKSLQKMADKALYLSKDRGRNTYRYYDETLTT